MELQMAEDTANADEEIIQRRSKNTELTSRARSTALV
jgi:hypothetical protein